MWVLLLLAFLVLYWYVSHAEGGTMLSQSLDSSPSRVIAEPEASSRQEPEASSRQEPEASSHQESRGSCDTYTCPPGFSKRVDGQAIHCPEYMCADADRDLCCVQDSPGYTTCASATCPPGFSLRNDAESGVVRRRQLCGHRLPPMLRPEQELRNVQVPSGVLEPTRRS